MGKAKRLISNLINPEVEQDLTQETLGNLRTLFAGQRNELTDLAARQNIGADAEASRLRRSRLDESGAESTALANLQKFFQDQRFKQAGLFLQNKGLNIQKEAQETDFMDILASFAGGAGRAGGQALGASII